MENYDPQFNSIVNKGDVVIGGYNFGTGSSREQAVTAFKHRGTSPLLPPPLPPLVSVLVSYVTHRRRLVGVAVLIAGSFSETYIRNAINNGFICIELPELVDQLKASAAPGTLTARLNGTLSIDFKRVR